MIVAGFGCRARATPAALAAALAATGHDRPDALAIPADRAALAVDLIAQFAASTAVERTVRHDRRECRRLP